MPVKESLSVLSVLVCHRSQMSPLSKVSLLRRLTATVPPPSAGSTAASHRRCTTSSHGPKGQKAGGRQVVGGRVMVSNKEAPEEQNGKA
jgi:hypothetical protein